MKKLLLMIAALFCFNSAYAVEFDSDSLEKILKTRIHDTTRVKVYGKLFLAYEYSDTTRARAYLNKMYTLSKKINYQPGLGLYYTNLAYFLEDKAKHAEALMMYEKALTIFQELKDHSKIAVAYKNMANSYIYGSNLEKAVEYIIKAKKEAELAKNLHTLEQVIYESGSIYLQLNKYKEALAAYHECLEIDKKLKSPVGMAHCYTNIGVTYTYLHEFDKSFPYYLKAQKIYAAEEQEIGMSNLLNWMGVTRVEEKRFAEALTYFKGAIALYEKLDNLNGLSYAYTNAAEAYAELGQFAEALEINKKSLDVAVQTNNIQYIQYNHQHLAINYARIGNFKEAYYHQKKYIEIKDSMTKATSIRDIEEMESKYQSEKKELQIKNLQNKQTIDALKINKAKEDKEAQQKNFLNLVIGSAIGFCLLIIIAILIYIGYRRKKNDNYLLSRQKNEIEQKNNALNQQNIEIAKQHGIIEEKNKEIIDSIVYARRIQSALLTSDEYIAQHISNYFILYQPKDIVSGDFYWALKHKDIFYFATADCTGHGVPGAFMSMLGISYLNEIILEEHAKDPAGILNLLRKNIVNALNQDKKSNTRDGMDIVLCAYDFINMKLDFACANNPLFVLRQGELTEYTPDKFPVGLHDEILPFTNQSIEIKKEDLIFTSTDGFADQFGGKDGKKFKKIRLKELFAGMTGKSTEEQKTVLLNEFNNWKKGYEQLDDVCIIGVRI